MLTELPRWLQEMPPGMEKDRATQTFMLRLAIIYSHPSADTQNFARMIGVHYPTLKSQIQARVRTSDMTRQGILRVLGPEFVPPTYPYGAFIHNGRG